MRQHHNSLMSDRKRKTLRDTSLSCDIYKFETLQERLCLKCEEKFLSKRPYNRICEKCSLINKKIALKTHSVSSIPLGEENPLSRPSSRPSSRYFPVRQEGRSADS